MFILELYDREGTKLELGDIVKLSDGRRFTFFAEVKYLEDQQAITPFHTFSFHSIVKVNEIPPSAQKSKEDRYSIWFVDSYAAEPDESAADFSHYLTEWRACERELDWRIYRIKAQP